MEFKRLTLPPILVWWQPEWSCHYRTACKFIELHASSCKPWKPWNLEKVVNGCKKVESQLGHRQTYIRAASSQLKTNWPWPSLDRIFHSFHYAGVGSACHLNPSSTWHRHWLSWLYMMPQLILTKPHHWAFLKKHSLREKKAFTRIKCQPKIKLVVSFDFWVSHRKENPPWLEVLLVFICNCQAQVKSQKTWADSFFLEATHPPTPPITQIKVWGVTILKLTSLRV